MNKISKFLLLTTLTFGLGFVAGCDDDEDSDDGGGFCEAGAIDCICFPGGDRCEVGAVCNMDDGLCMACNAGEENCDCNADMSCNDGLTCFPAQGCDKATDRLCRDLCIAG